MADIYSTAFMMKVVEKVDRPSSFILNTYFPFLQTFDTEEIHFDVMIHGRTLAPFVSPVVEGKIVQEKGITTNSMKPAYVKPKTPLIAGEAIKRRAGEQIGGALSPQERQLQRIGRTIEEHINMISRRKEVMAAEVMRTGTLLIEGEKYPQQLLNFGRDSELTQTLTLTARWGETGVNPLDDLQNWALLVLKKSGTQPTTVTMDVDAWRLFIASSDVKSQLDTRHVTNNAIENKIHSVTGGIYQGRIGGFDFYTYADFYQDDAGVLQPVLPSYTVLMGGEGIEGVQAHGAIQDDSAGFMSLEYYTKTWLEPDPAMRFVMTQSAPLVVPCNVNASFCATVR